MAFVSCLSPLMLMLMTLMLSAAAAGSGGGGVAEYEAQFEAWCAEHGRSYATPGERAARLAAFADNAAFVAAHNGAPASYALALNAFADLTHDEFRARASAACRRRRAAGGPGRTAARRTWASTVASGPCPMRWTGGRAAPSPRSRTKAAAVRAQSSRSVLTFTGSKDFDLY